ncbi:MAG: ABC transporter ATP-binding protein [Desulfurococcales archaeon]|nr:ABC transporter ATP-binding protein [Desulfurococcales archaeon]
MAVVEARDVWKRYREGGDWVLRGLSLRVEPGERVGIAGANGSGKTTLLRILSGLLHPSRGEVLVGGEPARSASARARVGVVLHNSFLYDELSVRENLEYYSVLYGVEYDPLSDPIVERLGLRKYLERPAGELSFGWRRRADIARALLHRPRVLLIDEPFTGLDESGATSLAGLLKDLSGGGVSVVATSPRASDLRLLEPRVLYWLREGVLVAE